MLLEVPRMLVYSFDLRPQIWSRTLNTCFSLGLKCMLIAKSPTARTVAEIESSVSYAQLKHSLLYGRAFPLIVGYAVVSIESCKKGKKVLLH